ncbi:hypothetical protein BASA50_009250 [Batrachochytrium salamandrivorans]|uniref:Uncharacterized protein n=1 Tax=Batrachochytrium salamandrivorans TaxID=1357716 RepID=A0ABQ8F1T6_9FUNG|nr:hypothetical protein BASA50_009250 [Batrachochytrium salamandrivorans]
MKLISFAVVSLLAITVSAHKPKRPFSFKYARQHNQDVVEVKIEKLEEDYRAKQEAILKLEGLKDAEYKERTTKSIMEKLEKELKNDSLSEDKKSYLMRQSNFAFENWKCARDSLVVKQGNLIKAMEERNYVEMGLSILKENIERQPDPDPNDESQDLMGASYDSNLPREILAEQIGEFFQDSADLSAIDE